MSEEGHEELNPAGTKVIKQYRASYRRAEENQWLLQETSAAVP